MPPIIRERYGLVFRAVCSLASTCVRGPRRQAQDCLEPLGQTIYSSGLVVERRGRVFSRDQLLDAIWQNETFVEPRTVDVHVRRLRTQIEDDPSNPKYIKTRRGVGYYVE